MGARSEEAQRSFVKAVEPGSAKRFGSPRLRNKAQNDEWQKVVIESWRLTLCENCVSQLCTVVQSTAIAMGDLPVNVN